MLFDEIFRRPEGYPASFEGCYPRHDAQKTGPVRLMEICGTHTMAIAKAGLRSAACPRSVRLLSGPGCPVCVDARRGDRRNSASFRGRPGCDP